MNLEQANHESDRRRWRRNLLDSKLDQHRHVCPFCKDFRDNDIRDGKSECLAGTKLALQAWTAGEQLGMVS